MPPLVCEARRLTSEGCCLMHAAEGIDEAVGMRLRARPHLVGVRMSSGLEIEVTQSEMQSMKMDVGMGGNGQDIIVIIAIIATKMTQWP